jgi:glycosyltransferase involved in cell wall biosynthesis
MPPSKDSIIPASRDEGEARARLEAIGRELAASAKPRLLFVTHGRGGGVARHVAELASSLSGGAHVLLLKPWRRSFVELCGTGEHEDLRLWFHGAQEWDSLLAFLRSLGVARVHYHHVQGLPARVLGIGATLGVAWDVTIHDYYPLCPQYQLTDASGRYCGEPDAAGCARCLAASPPQWDLDITGWRQAFAPVLAGAGRVIAPSKDAAERIRRYFPEARPLVWSHGEEPCVAPRRRKVLVLGALSRAKGMDLLVACARDALARALPLAFRVVGPIAWPVEEALPLAFSGEFAEGRLAELLEQERGDAIFFPAQWPETYSYTLSAAIVSGLPILATNLGAFPERLSGHPRAQLVDWRADPSAVNDALLRLANDAQVPGLAAASPPAAPADYARRYLEGIPSGPRPPAPPAPAPCGRVLPPDEVVPQATLKELFDDGVGAGNGRSRAMLAQRAVKADEAMEELRIVKAQLAQAQEALAGAQARLAELPRREEALADAIRQRDAALERAVRLESSTSWRLTAPLRALVRFLRR